MSAPSDRPFKSRSHYTRTGEAKKPLTVDQCRSILAENPGMEMYTCNICRQLHVGNRALKMAVL